jgi:hypothetical protein
MQSGPVTLTEYKPILDHDKKYSNKLKIVANYFYVSYYRNVWNP